MESLGNIVSSIAATELHEQETSTLEILNSFWPMFLMKKSPCANSFRSIFPTSIIFLFTEISVNLDLLSVIS